MLVSILSIVYLDTYRPLPKSYADLHLLRAFFSENHSSFQVFLIFFLCNELLLINHFLLHVCFQILVSFILNLTQQLNLSEESFRHLKKVLSFTFPEKAMAPHSSTLSWKIPWMEEPGMGSLRVGHDWATSLSLFTFMHWRRKWQPTPVFLPGKSQGQGSLVGWRLWGHTELDTIEVT